MTKAKALAVHTIRICGNEKYFPKRFRWCFTSELVKSALAINLNIEKANSIYLKGADEEALTLRRKYQTIALAETYAMTNLISLAIELFGLSGEKAEYWVRMVKETRDLIRSWRKSEK